MERFQVLLTPEQLDQLRAISEEKGTPVAQLLRDALDQYLVMGEVPFDGLDKLPKRSGVYIVFTDSELLYIGQSKNIRARWKNHHKTADIQQHKDVTILWLAIEPDGISEVERLLIGRLLPSLNGIRYITGESVANDYVSVNVYTGTHSDAKKAAAILGIHMLDFFYDAVVEKIQRDLPDMVGIWATVPPPK